MYTNEKQPHANPGIVENGEGRLRNILMDSPVSFAVLSGPDMIVEFANKPILDSWKRDTNIIGRPLLEVMPEMSSQLFSKQIVEVLNTGRPIHGHEQLATITQHGVPTPTYYNYVYQPVQNDNGTVTGVAVLATDVTEQVLGRQFIQESEKRFRALVTATSDLVYRMNADWTEIYELHGRGLLSDVAKPTANWINSYVPEQERLLVQEAIKATIVSGNKFELEHRINRTDGTTGWIFSRAIPIKDAQGNITEWFGTATDISSKKEAEAALAASQEMGEARKRLYETVTNNTPDLIYVFSLDYKFIYANQALLTMWGKTWEDAIGKGLPENGYEDWHTAMHHREIDQVVATRQPIRGVVSFPHAVLGKRIYDYIFVPVINDHGQVEAVAGTTRDITEIRLAEEALKRSREELESLVEDRTRALQRSNADLGQFAHVASHDLKEPVRKINLFAGLLKESSSRLLTDDGLKYLDKILSSSRRMSSMIEGILTYSSFEANKEDFVNVDLTKILNEVIEDLELVIEEKNATIQYGQLPVVQGSPLLLTQLFANLISNSLKFARKSISSVITITSANILAKEFQQRSLSPENYVQITVQDNGIGFREEDATDLFQTFSRLNPKDKYEGTGLGLALCRKIVERHHGIINATGRPDNGATITILLPEA